VFKITGMLKDLTKRIADFKSVRLARDERGEKDTVEGKVKILNEKTQFSQRKSGSQQPSFEYKSFLV
jgi:hypothetical protein